MSTENLPSRSRATAPVYLLVCLGMVLSGVVLAVFAQSTRESAARLATLGALRDNSTSLGARLEFIERLQEQRSSAMLSTDPGDALPQHAAGEFDPTSIPPVPAIEQVEGMPPRLSELRDKLSRMRELESRTTEWREQFLLTHQRLLESREGAMARSVAIRNTLLSIQGKQRLQAAQNSGQPQAGGLSAGTERVSTDRLLIELMDTSVAIMALLEAHDQDAVTDIAANRLVPILYRLRSSVGTQTQFHSDFKPIHGFIEELAIFILGKEAATLPGFVSTETFRSGLIADCVLRLSSLQHRRELEESVDGLAIEFDTCRTGINDLIDAETLSMRTAIRDALYASIRRCVLTVSITVVIFAGFGWRVGRTIRQYADCVESITRQVLSSTAMLNDTGRLARVGGWELNVASGGVSWSDVVYDIHEVPLGTAITLDMGIGFYAPECRDQIKSAVERAISDGVGWDLELQLITTTGRRIWARALGEVVKKDGVVVTLKGAFQDITDRKRMEQQTRDAEQFLRSAIDSLDSHTAVLSSDGRILSVNRAWREFAMSNNAGDLGVLEGADYLTPCDQAAPTCPEAGEVAQAIRAVLKGESEPLAIQYACHSPGEKRWFQASIRGFSCGSERFAVVSHLNITAVKEAEAKLLTTNADLVVARTAAEAASRAKSEFLANMSHEIRTPLTAILGFADILREDGNLSIAPDHRVQTLDTISSAGRHLLTVINDILDLSKIEADKMTVERIDTPLVQVLGEVASLMRPRALGKGLALSMCLGSPVPARVQSDPTRLRQILMNLAGNAVKFTESGGVTMTIGVEAHDGQSLLVVDIVDTGPGMTDEQAGRLFATFGQADTTVTRKHGGTGLGLTISRRLANLMGGDVKLLRTQPGKGSCFRLVLPLNVCAGSAMITSMDAVQPDAPAKPVTASVQVQGRILLAEDGVDNQRLIMFHLKKAGAAVDLADNGRIALEMLEKARSEGNPYDLLLTDMQMPEMDGYTLARTVRERGSTIPIVALTAHAMAEDRAKCLAAGCDDYASKPIDKSRLLATCAGWIGGRHGEKALDAAA
ncbi:MAG: ATP-binding protein [Planctomycetota bacterium]